MTSALYRTISRRISEHFRAVLREHWQPITCVGGPRLLQILPSESGTWGQLLRTAGRMKGCSSLDGGAAIFEMVNKVHMKTVGTDFLLEYCYYSTRPFGPTLPVHLLSGRQLSELRPVSLRRVEVSRFPMMYLRAASPQSIVV